jgi:hypothetical protein
MVATKTSNWFIAACDGAPQKSNGEHPKEHVWFGMEVKSKCVGRWLAVSNTHALLYRAHCRVLANRYDATVHLSVIQRQKLRFIVIHSFLSLVKPPIFNTPTL